MKIPILWRVERFIVRKQAEKEKEARPAKLLSKHKRTYGRVCPECENTKWFKRKNNEKCTKCGYKVYF